MLLQKLYFCISFVLQKYSFCLVSVLTGFYILSKKSINNQPVRKRSYVTLKKSLFIQKRTFLIT